MPSRLNSLRVETTVELVGAGCLGVNEIAAVVLASALSARSVSGSERGRIIQEEEPGVTAGRHRLAPAPPKLEPARDPPATVVVPTYPALVVVQASTVAKDETSLRRLDQFSKRRDAIAERHLDGV
jgi:hypothetical protein